jgi:hypothetical protein
VGALAFLAGCAKDIVRLDRNRPPQTFIVAAPVDSAGARDASQSNFRVHLYWRGEDSDGFVVGFLWSFDDSSLGAARYTTRTDSVFDLLVNDSTVFTGATTPALSKYHTFYVKAIDNLGKPDPGFAFFNRRTFSTSTLPPTIRFLGGLPSHRKITRWIGPGPADSETVELVDTLADGTPFQVCWTGYDPDNPPSFGVPRYHFKAGNYESGIVSDTCAFFNDAANPRSIGLASNLYKMTVKGFDIANAVGDSGFIFVVNYDPDTWILPQGPDSGWVGHYIQRFRGGSELDPPDTGIFRQGDRVPYRSTVWWDWDGSDTRGGESNCLSGWSVVCSGTHNDGAPYSIGFLDTLSPGASPVRFKTNNPAVVGPAGFLDLILDSLDSFNGIQLLVRSRDCSGRVDGTPAIFTFSCNFPPKLESVAYDTLLAVNQETNQVEWHVRISWNGTDYEDGHTTYARLSLDGVLNVEVAGGANQYLIPVSTFKRLSSGCEGVVRVIVADRTKEYITYSEGLDIRFPLPDCP